MNTVTFWRRFLVVVAANVLAGRVGVMLTTIAQNETSMWPTAGISLAATIVWGPRMAPAVFLGILGFLLSGTAMPWVVAVFVSIGCSLSALLGATLLRSRTTFDPRLATIRDVTSFIVYGVLIGQIPNALIGPLAQWLYGVVPLSSLQALISRWWTASTFGVFWFAPLLLVWSQRFERGFLRQRRLEAFALVAGLAAFMLLFFNNNLASWRAETYLIRPHTLFPFFVWATLRFQQRGAATLGFLTLTTMAAAILGGSIPYSTMSVGRNLEYLQSFVTILNLTSLFLGAAVQQYNDTLRDLHFSERSARKRESEFRALFEYSGAGHAQIDMSTGRFLRVNSKLCEILGYQADELLGRRFDEITLAEDLGISESSYKSLVSGRSVVVEKRYVRRDGEIIWARVTASVIAGPDGKFQTSLAIIDDITEHKCWEATLQDAKRAADAASLAKTRFLANISHEIRTPLGAILGFNEFSFDPQQSSRDRLECARKIKDNGDLLLKIINDVLDLSKIEAGRLEVERCSMSVSEMIDDIESLLLFKAQENCTKLSIRSEGPIPAKIESDPTRLRQILVNIVGNAIKFSEKGSVSVVARFVKGVHEHDPSRLEFLVQDTGLGMTEEQMARIFEPFHQADPSTTRKFGGTGLGLALSRRFARALNGDLTLAQSKPGTGSTFVVEVEAIVPPGTDFYDHTPNRPKRAGATKESRPTRGSTLRNIKALVVDDAPDNRLLISRFLEREGAEVVQAENGEEGIEKALAGDFDVLLIDIQMPGLDGLEATKLLRAKGFTRPILAVTANAMKDDRQLALNAGFDDHLSKPVSPVKLIDSVKRFIGASLD